MPDGTMPGLVRRTDALHVRAIREADREADFIASTETIDSYDEIIDAASWKLDRFKKNPVILYGHQSYELPIGQATRCEVVGKELHCTIKFASAEANPEAEKVWKLVIEKVLRAVSVGFRPTDGKYELRDGRDVYVLYGADLREISIVAIPANPDCLAKMKADGLEAADPATRERIRSAITARSASTKPPSEPTAPSTPTNDSATKGVTEPDMINVKTLLALLSLQESATEDDVLAKVKAMGEDRAALKVANEKATSEAARAAAAEAKVATLESEKAVLSTELTKASTDRDAATKRASDAEDKLVELEVDSLVGKKIAPTEKDDFVALRKNSPELFKSMVEKRADMALTERVTTPDAKNAAPPALNGDATGSYLAKL